MPASQDKTIIKKYLELLCAQQALPIPPDLSGKDVLTYTTDIKPIVSNSRPSSEIEEIYKTGREQLQLRKEKHPNKFSITQLCWASLNEIIPGKTAFGLAKTELFGPLACIFIAEHPELRHHLFTPEDHSHLHGTWNFLKPTDLDNQYVMLQNNPQLMATLERLSKQEHQPIMHAPTRKESLLKKRKRPIVKMQSDNLDNLEMFPYPWKDNKENFQAWLTRNPTAAAYVSLHFQARDTDFSLDKCTQKLFPVIQEKLKQAQFFRHIKIPKDHKTALQLITLDQKITVQLKKLKQHIDSIIPDTKKHEHAQLQTIHARLTLLKAQAWQQQNPSWLENIIIILQAMFGKFSAKKQLTQLSSQVEQVMSTREVEYHIQELLQLVAPPRKRSSLRGISPFRRNSMAAPTQQAPQQKDDTAA
jgi:hypothetical protein